MVTLSFIAPSLETILVSFNARDTTILFYKLIYHQSYIKNYSIFIHLCRWNTPYLFIIMSIYNTCNDFLRNVPLLIFNMSCSKVLEEATEWCWQIFVILISEFGLLMEYSYIFFYFWVLRRISNVALSTDLAFRIIHMYAKLVNYVNDQGLSPLHILASKPSAFRSGSHIGGWYKWIYHCNYH